MSDRVTVSREDHLAIVSLSHPDRLNVLDRQGWESLADIMTALGEDQGVCCVVIKGSGDRAFSAGSDIGGFSSRASDARAGSGVRPRLSSLRFWRSGAAPTRPWH